MAKRRQSPLWTDPLLLAGLALLLASLPVFSGLRQIEFISPMITNIPELDSGIRSDLFNEAKFTFLLSLAVLLLLLFALQTLRSDYEVGPSPYHLPLALFAGAVVISLLLSPFPALALYGFPKHTRMGTLTYLAGVAALFIGLQTREVRRRPGVLFYAVAPFVLVNLVVSLLYFYGFDLLKTDAVRQFFTPANGTPVQFGGVISTTLDNPNYSSGLGGATGSLFLAGALLLRDRWGQAACLLLSISSFTVVVASVSASGFLALTTVGLPLLLLAYLFADRRQVLRNGLAALAGCALVWAVLHGARPESVTRETVGLYSQIYREAVLPLLQGGAPAPAAAPPEPTDGAFRLPEPPKHEQSIATDRGRIWRESLKLIRRRPWFGHGLDTIAYTFPHEDPSIGTEFVTVKPHNMYLDLAYGSGIPALLAFLALPGILLWQSRRRLQRHMVESPYLVGLLAASAAYLVQGLVNDSVVGSWAVFCVWIGASANLLGAEVGAAQAAPGDRAGARAAQ